MTELRLPEINRVLISGRLTRDPDRRFASDGTAVTTFDLAFHRRYRNRDGSAGEQTGFVTVVTYQRVAEVVGEYLKKGSAVMIEGRLQMRDWKSEHGERRTRIEIRADMVHFLDRRGIDAGEESAAGPEAPAVSESGQAGRARRAGRRSRG